MRCFASGIFALLIAPGVVNAADSCPDTLNHDMRVLAGEEQVNLCEAYLGDVVLVVNTASKCAFTDQYGGLESLYRKYRDRGFVVLGFPSNDFGAQEPGPENQIKEFCRLTYSVEFPMFEKTHAREDKAGPFYRTLGELAGTFPKWNFHKYLLDREGRLVASFSSFVSPESKRLVREIESLL